MSDSIAEVFRALREGQHRYAYFMLGTAGAGVALAVNETHGLALALSQGPLAVAVFAWGLSFYCGARSLAWANATLYANFNLLRVEAGQEPSLENHREKIEAASEGIRIAIEHNSNRANTLAHWQFALLVGGAVCYVLARFRNVSSYARVMRAMPEHGPYTLKVGLVFPVRDAARLFFANILPGIPPAARTAHRRTRELIDGNEGVPLLAVAPTVAHAAAWLEKVSERLGQTVATTARRALKNWYNEVNRCGHWTSHPFSRQLQEMHRRGVKFRYVARPFSPAEPDEE